MPNTVLSPNMGITVPVVLTDPGPDWATNIYNALFATIDAHDHSSGKGVQVPTAGIGINADLGFASFNATSLRSTRYTSQSVALALGTDVGCSYNLLGDLYWNNASGTPIQLTKNGLPNSTFTKWNSKTVSGSYTILVGDTTVLYFVGTGSSAPTIFLPASSSLSAGSIYLFLDYQRNAEANAVTVTPNGTDQIDGVNASITWQQNGGLLQVTTDAAGHWFTEYMGAKYVKQNGLTFPASASPLFSQAQQANGSNPSTWVFSSQAPGAGASTTPTGTPGGFDFDYGVPVSTGAEAGFRVRRGSSPTTQLRFGQAGTFPTLHMGTAGDAPTTGNYALLATSDGLQTWLNGAGQLHLAVGNVIQAEFPSAGNFNFPSATNLQVGGSTIAALTSGGFAISSSAGPTITSGSGAPASSPPNGSIYLNTSGTSSTGIYLREGGAWQAMTAGLAAPVALTVRTITANYTIDASGADYLVLCNAVGAITVTLPSPTTGRSIILKDISGNLSTNNITLARFSTEKVEGVAASQTLQTNWGKWTITSNGTDWFLT